ncbi:MAG: phage tail protein [Nitriliruptorales bacterium]|nr:phage tail protein [Nitriliruptorales bacterium]
MADPTADAAVAVCFAVKIDGQDMGAFTSCDGLSFEVQVEQREEGGNNAFIHQLPGRVRYTNIKLTRPVTQESNRLAAWFATMTYPIKRTQAEIRAMTADGKTVATWGLTGVIPVKWQGPSMSAESPKVASETLEIAHHGFLNTG